MADDLSITPNTIDIAKDLLAGSMTTQEIARQHNCSIADVSFVKRGDVFKTALLEALECQGYGTAELAETLIAGLRAVKIIRKKPKKGDQGGRPLTEPDHSTRLKYLAMMQQLLYKDNNKRAKVAITLGKGANEPRPPIDVTPHSAEDPIDVAARSTKRAKDVRRAQNRALRKNKATTVPADMDFGLGGPDQEVSDIAYYDSQEEDDS